MEREEKDVPVAGEGMVERPRRGELVINVIFALGFLGLFGGLAALIRHEVIEARRTCSTTPIERIDGIVQVSPSYFFNGEPRDYRVTAVSSTGELRVGTIECDAIRVVMDAPAGQPAWYEGRNVIRKAISCSCSEGVIHLHGPQEVVLSGD